MPETKKYIVTQKHALNYKVGEVIDLTNVDALKLVNKIKLAPVVESPAKKETKKNKKAAK